MLVLQLPIPVGHLVADVNDKDKYSICNMCELGI